MWTYFCQWHIHNYLNLVHFSELFNLCIAPHRTNLNLSVTAPWSIQLLLLCSVHVPWRWRCTRFGSRPPSGSSHSAHPRSTTWYWRGQRSDSSRRDTVAHTAESTEWPTHAANSRTAAGLKSTTVTTMDVLACTSRNNNDGLVGWLLTPRRQIHGYSRSKTIFVLIT